MTRVKALAISLFGLGALATASPLALHAYDSWRQSQLLREAPPPHILSVRRSPSSLAAAVMPDPPTGQLVGRLFIPAIHVNVAVLEGTSDAVLLQAPGHYSRSVLPGEPGLSVIAAHNATYFHLLDRLSVGSRFVVTTRQGQFEFAVTGHEIVADNQGLPDSSLPTVALEACYPLNAMYFTPNRYVVFAKLVRSILKAPKHISPVEAPSTTYAAAILPAIARAYPLWLAQNNLPMGTLGYQTPTHGPAYQRFLATDAPLAVTAQAIRLLEAYRYVSQNREQGWLASLLPVKGSLADNPFWGASKVVFDWPIQLTMTLNSRAVPTEVTILAPYVHIDNRTESLLFRIAVTGNTLSLVSVTPAG